MQVLHLGEGLNLSRLAVGSGRRRAEPGPRQPRHVLRLPRARRGQQLPHVLLQRQDGVCTIPEF